jgi:hypothetical protein
MTDAPEKLTLTPDHSFGDPWFNGSIGNDDPMEDGEDTSYGYTRTDLYDAAIVRICSLEGMQIFNRASILQREARIAKLESFIDKAFEAHSNLDLDIEALQENN